MSVVRTHHVLLAAALSLVGLGVWLGARPVHAQSTPTTLFVSGLHLGAKSPVALVTLSNTSRASADFYTLSYQVYHADGRRAADPVNLTTPLLSGRAITIDVAGGVNTFRAGLELGPFAGPVLLVVRGTSCADTGTCPVGAVPRPFGPQVIHVEAVQSEGSATYDAAVHWFVAQ